jgi:hypothetical protein
MFTTSSRGPARLARRVFSALTLVMFLVTVTGCSTWKVQPITKLSYPDYQLVRESARFHLVDGRTVTMEVVEVDYPLVRGWLLSDLPHDELGRDVHGSPANSNLVEVDCRDVTKLELRKTSGTTTAVAIVAGFAVVVILILAAASDDEPSYSSTSTSSCPVLYVSGGGADVLVGEPYAGAAAKSIQRRDLLALPTGCAEAARLDLRLTNEARETQYTDTARLVLVDHARGARVVATNEQDALAVGEARPALDVTTLAGTDVTPLVAGADSLQWETDLSGCVGRPEFPLVEGLVASFTPPTGGGQPVLELDLGNTYWLDLVMNRFLALLGDRFESGMERASHERTGPRLRSWLTREGVDLTVEVQTGDGWREVGCVRPVGPLALRRVAVPLPADLAAGAGPLTVRLTGGAGFWRVDRVALSAAAAPLATVQRLDALAVTDQDGRDQRGLVAAEDGRCQALERIGDTIALTFAVPPAAPGLERSAFFESSGYYVAHRPVQSARSLATFRTIVDEPGALSRFSLDLFRKYAEVALRTPVTAGQPAGAS